MGYNNPGRLSLKDKKEPVRPAQKYGTSATNSATVASSISTVKQGLLAEAVDLCTLSGDLISFTRTSDGGAWCVYIKSGQDAYKFFPHNTEELEGVLDQICAGAR